MQTTVIVDQRYGVGIDDRLTLPDDPGTSSGYTASRDWFAMEQLALRDQRGIVVVNNDTALTYSVVFACVRYISQTIASLCWHVYERQDNGKSKKELDDNIAWTLEMQASPECSAFDWRQVMLKDALTWGNGYAEIERIRSGQPWALWRIDPARVQVVRSNSRRLLYEVKDPDGGDSQYLDPANVFHLKGPGPDGLVGWSMIRIARHAIELGMSQERFGEEFFKRGPMPGGVLKFPGPVKDEERKAIRKSFQEAHGGAQNAGKIIVLSGGADYDPLKLLPNSDAQFLDSRRFSLEELCRFYGVPPHKVADLQYCLPADTLVYTENGPRRIVDIAKGERVWSVGESGLELSEVLNNWDNGIKELVELKTTNRTLRCTPNHRVLARRPFCRPSEKGEVGGKSIDGKKMRVEWRNEYVEAGLLREGDMLITLGRLPDAGATVAPNGRKLTVEFMEFCGLLIGDGNIQKERGKPRGVSIARSSKASYMPHYREAARAEFVAYSRGRNGRTVHGAQRRPVHLHETERATIFASTLAAGELSELGFSGTAFTKSVPPWVFGLTDNLKLAFLRGFLDADGTVDGKGRITFYSANRRMLDQMRHLCMGLGVPVTNRRSDVNRKPAPGSKVLVPTRVWRFTCSDPGANRRIGSHDERYKVRFQAGKPFCRKDRNYPRFGGAVGIDGLAAAKIVCVTRLPAERTYDLEVAGTHSFIADGVAVHNSTNNNIEHQAIEAVQDCLLPWCRRLETEADIKLFGPDQRGKRFTRLDLRSLLRGDSQTLTESLTRQVTGGLRTVNEGREELDLNPIEGGDTPLIQGAMVPLDAALSGETVPGKSQAPAPSTEGAPPNKGGQGEKAPAKQQAAAIRETFGQLLYDSYGRLLRVEADKARRGSHVGVAALAPRARSGDAKQPESNDKLRAFCEAFYTPDYESFVAAAVTPAISGLYLALGRPLCDAELAAKRLAKAHVAESKKALLDEGLAAASNWHSDDPACETRARRQAAAHLELAWKA